MFSLAQKLNTRGDINFTYFAIIGYANICTIQYWNKRKIDGGGILHMYSSIIYIYNHDVQTVILSVKKQESSKEMSWVCCAWYLAELGVVVPGWDAVVLAELCVVLPGWDAVVLAAHWLGSVEDGEGGHHHFRVLPQLLLLLLTPGGGAMAHCIIL